MATQAIAGRRGYIGFSATSSGSASEVAEITDYELLVDAEQVDASSFDSSGWNEHLPVIREWELSYSLIASSNNWTQAYNGWQTILTATAKRWMTLYPSTSSTGNRYRGYVLAEAAELTGDVGDVFRLDTKWAGHGPLLYTS